MAPNKFATMLHRRTNKITRVLIYAFLEWTLIFLLLLNSLFSYFILKFALYFGLKPPCFLCSRIDHFLDSHKKPKHNKPTFSSYSEIICEQHAAEISRIGYCSHHRKLVESHSMCEGCSSSSSSDPELVKWLTEIGIVKADEDDDSEDDVAKKCSCCGGVLIKTNPISKVSSSDFVIKERELLGDLFSDQNVQIGSDQSDDQPKFGYQILEDGDEEDEDASEEDDVIFQAEKEPLLDNTKENNGEKEETVGVTTQNLCPDMLPQHLEFYIDHDDYRLIPIEFVNDDSVKVDCKNDEVGIVGEEEKKENSGFSTEFELVFDGYELVLPGCEVTTSKDLPCIQEDEEIVTLSLQTSQDEEKMVVSDKVELVFEGNELFTAGCETENSHISENEESKGGSDNFELVLEGNERLANVCETENSQNFKAEEKIGGSDKFKLVFEGNELLAGFESENLQNPKDTQKEDGSEIFELAFEGDKLVGGSESDIISISSPKEEDECSPENLQIYEDEKKREIDISILLEEQEDIATVESTPILEESNNEGIEEVDSKVTAETPSTSPVSTEDNTASHLKTDESDNDGKEQNPTEKLLFLEYEANLASLMRSYEMETQIEKNQNSTDELLIIVDESPKACKQESHTITDNIVSYDAEISEGSQNVGMSRNEVEEERVLDTPTSSESLHKSLLLLGRRESATEESLDGISMISEQESTGQTVEKLKVDLLSERKAFRALYKELEEERNASAIAANQTMAMITRLQEEKATMQMEALQYQRMMEEQSEYDQEALQMMNELVVKREKEKQELEKELEVYRKKVMDYEERERMRIMCRRRSRNSSASCSYGEESDGLSIDLNQEVKDHEEDAGTSPHSQEENGPQDTPTDAVLCLQDSLAGFEEERQAILEQLKVLEEKLVTLAEEEEEHFENMKPFDQFYEESGKEFDVNNGGDTNGFIHANGNHQQERRINDSMPKKLLLPLFDAVEFSTSPNGELNGNEDGFHITKFELEKKRFAVEEEVDHVYERLQALEADREFLKHCIGSLRKGDKGLDLLQEILQHLRDLKNVEVQAMKNTDHGASV